MKKLFLAAALALAVAGSWAFNTSAPQPRAYMQMIFVNVGNRDGLITLISPEGRITKIESTELDRTMERGKAVVKLNELAQQGWQVVQVQSVETPSTAPTYQKYTTETYWLERQ